jgi:uncharacterized membrane protein YfcA
MAMPQLDFIGWLVVALCALLIGATKTGIPGLGILVVPLIATVVPARASTGILLGILILGDLFAVTYHRHNASWRHVLRLLPATVAGIVAGYLVLSVVSNKQLAPIIGAIVLGLLGLHHWRARAGGAQASVPTRRWFALTMGFAAGATSMMANAAGPVMTIYLLAMRLPKVAFVGTSAWFFFIVNWLKVPFSANLSLMTAESIKLDLMMLPAIAVGALIGVFILKRIPQRVFNAVVQILAALAALRLLLAPFM